MEILTGDKLKSLFISGCNNLNNNKDYVDSLNVFPVPDGDTGTNMSLTFTNGIAEMEKSGSDAIPVLAKTLSRGLLMGARGNSGVILSQIFRGFYQSVKEKNELTTADLNEAFLNGSRMAYKAVMRPVEGTILTVIRESTEKTSKALEENPDLSIEEFISLLYSSADESLQNTPELLPVLKEANVVDSGGCGLVKVFEGFNAYCSGKPIEGSQQTSVVKESKTEKSSGYRAEYILRFDQRGKLSFNEDRVRKNLEKIGNELTLLVDDETLKVRINTMSPGEILTLGQRYGDFTKIQIENIQDDLKPSIIEETKVSEERKPYGIIAVAAGSGIEKLFKEYRVDIIISGGQTMNPSTEDFVKAIDQLNADTIFVLPNNSNIVMAAKQASAVESNKNIVLLETTSIQQGLSACISFNPDETPEANAEAMKEAIEFVKSGSITYAIKDTSIDGKEIHTGDYMGIFEKEIVSIRQDRLESLKELIDTMCDDESEIVTILVGEEGNKEECDSITEYITEKYDVEVDIEEGNQPVYAYLVSIE